MNNPNSTKFHTDADNFRGIIYLLHRLDIITDWEIHWQECLIKVGTRKGIFFCEGYDRKSTTNMFVGFTVFIGSPNGTRTRFP